MALLLFQIGDTQYGLELAALQEVADDPAVFFVPGGGEFVLGAINLHGRILPVIDLPGLLGFAEVPRDQRLVVLSPEFHSLALVVSGVGRIVPYEPTDQSLSPARPELSAVAGVLEIAMQPVNVLDPAALIERLQDLYAA